MDELNLSSRFAQDDEEDQRPNRRKKNPRFRTGVGMEKPHAREENVEEGSVSAAKGDEVDIGKDQPVSFDMIGADMGPMPEEGDAAFDDLVSRLEGESASAGRAREKREKLKKFRRPPIDEDLR